MEPEIGQTYLFLPTTKDLWDAVTKAYSDLGNSAQIYDLKTRIRETKQGSQGVTKYYNILKGLWQELDHYYDGEWESTIDSAKYKKMLEKGRVFEFLAGLSSEHVAADVSCKNDSNVWSKISLSKSLPRFAN